MITAKYILDNIQESKVVLFPNEAIDINYEKLKVGNPVINYISLDGLGIDLYDDTSVFAEDGDYCGYISIDVSDENSVSTDYIAAFGALSGDVTSAENNLEVTHGITINFEKDYATEILIVAFDKEDNQVYSNTFVINKLNNFLDIEPFVCNRIYVYFTKTNTPNSFIKINTFALGSIHSIDNFFDFELQDEKDLLSSDLPMGQAKFSTVSEENLIGREGNLLVVFDDTQLLGRYYLKEISKQSKTKYSFTIQNILYKLDKMVYSNEFAFNDSQWYYETVNAYDELVKLFKFVGVNYYIDESLKNIWLSPYMETGKTARYVLQQICFVCGAYVDCWNTDQIKVLANRPTYLTKTIKDADGIILETKVQYSTPASLVNWQIKYFEEQTKGEPEMIATVKASGTDIVEYKFEKETAVNDVVTDEAGDFNILELTPKHILLSPSNSFKFYYIWGYPLVETENNKTIYLREYGDKVGLNKYGLVGFKTNTLDIDDDGNIKTLDAIRDYYSKFGGKTLSAKIVYNGEKTGDLISIQTNDGSMFTGIITSLTFQNANNYRTAKIEVIEWNI